MKFMTAVPRQSARGWGLILLTAGAAMVLIALVADATASKRSMPTLCPGQRVVFADVSMLLASIQPVAGEGFTALETRLTLKRQQQLARELYPQLRQYRDDALAESGAARVVRWNGQVSVQSVSYNRASGCMLFDLHWRPLHNWIAYGAGLAIFGLLLALAKSMVNAATATRLRLNLTFCAIMLAIMALGYAVVWQKRPLLSAPFAGGPALIAVRDSLFHTGRPTNNRWIVIADAMARHGQYAEAATVLLGAVEQNHNDAEAWLALGDALYSAQDGKLTQAAIFAYDRADRVTMKSGEAGLVRKALELSGRGDLAVQWGFD